MVKTWLLIACGTGFYAIILIISSLQLLALVLRHYLANPQLMETAVGTIFDKAATENFVMLSDCVYHVLVSGKGKMETAVGTTFDKSATENLVMLSNCVYHVLVSGKGKMETAVGTTFDKSATENFVYHVLVSGKGRKISERIFFKRRLLANGTCISRIKTF